jgi:hypothetical protein
MSECVLRADIPVSYFVGMTVKEIWEPVYGLTHLLTYAESIEVRDGVGLIIQSPRPLVPQECAVLTMRWDMPDAPATSDQFWAFIRNGVNALQLAELVWMNFPGWNEVIMKDRLRAYTPDDFVPVPA